MQLRLLPTVLSDTLLTLTARCSSIAEQTQSHLGLTSAKEITVLRHQDGGSQRGGVDPRQWQFGQGGNRFGRGNDDGGSGRCIGKTGLVFLLAQ